MNRGNCQARQKPDVKAYTESFFGGSAWELFGLTHFILLVTQLNIPMNDLFVYTIAESIGWTGGCSRFVFSWLVAAMRAVLADEDESGALPDFSFPTTESLNAETWRTAATSLVRPPHATTYATICHHMSPLPIDSLQPPPGPTPTRCAG